MACAVALVCIALVGQAAEAKFANDEDTYTFAGHCPNGETYRIYAYQKLVENTRILIMTMKAQWAKAP